MIPPLPSLTATWHNDTYASISPSRPELSAAGKTVIITGAGSGIGRATALSFSRAGAGKLVLIGRDETKLLETQKALAVPSSVHAVSVTDEKGLKSVTVAVGTWDILILGAGYIATPKPIKDSEIDEWWQSFETNVKGSMIPTKIFLPTANPSHAAIIGLTAITVLPPTMLVGLSAYISSKLALARLLEYIAGENPSIFVAGLQPGMVETNIFNKSGGKKEQLPMDTVNLPADFTVWLTSSEASFLNGRQVWANWDVDELKAKAEEIKAGQLLTSGISGWPFSP